MLIRANRFARIALQIARATRVGISYTLQCLGGLFCKMIWKAVFSLFFFSPRYWFPKRHYEKILTSFGDWKSLSIAKNHPKPSQEIV